MNRASKPSASAMLGGKRVLVTGGTGLVGSAIIRALLAADSSVRIRAPYRSTGLLLEGDRIEYIKADLGIPDNWEVARGCDYAILGAAVTGGVASSKAEPWLQVTNNLVVDALSLQALHNAGVTRCVYLSSSTVYPQSEGLLTEDTMDWSQDPPDAYLGIGWAKRSAEKLCLFWYRKTGMEILTARLANAFGPGSRFDPAISNFVAATVRKAVEGVNPFLVWGSPNVERDIIYVDSVADGILTMLLQRNIVFETFNIGTGSAVTVDQIVRWTLEAVGRDDTPISYDAPIAGTMMSRVLSCEKAARLLPWRSTVDVREGLARTVAWWKENKDSWTR